MLQDSLAVEERAANYDLSHVVPVAAVVDVPHSDGSESARLARGQSVGRLLALDVGEKRVGVALCDETQTLARPLLTLKRASKKEDFAKLAALCREQRSRRSIVGLPKTLRNEEGPQARRVRRYADELAGGPQPPDRILGRTVFIGGRARTPGLIQTAAARKGEIDSAAAAIILQEYLDEQCINYDPMPI